MEHALRVVEEVGHEYRELTGREYGYLQKYRMEDAEIALIGLASTMGTARSAVDSMREQGYRMGLIDLRLYRPFPAEQLRNALKQIKVLGVMDRADTFSLNGGPLFGDIRNALYAYGGRMKIVNYIYGLGGRDINVSDLKKIMSQLVAINEGKEPENLVTYYGVRE